MAGGQLIGDATADQAAEWLTLLMSGEATDEDRRRWQQWRAAHLDHERAWKHIEAVIGRLKVMDPKAAYKALSPYAKPAELKSPGRRKAINLLLWCGVTGTTGVLASRTQTWQQAAADHHTGTGEQRSVTLDDGTRVTLNTGSAINVHFDVHRRLVRLVAGEVMIVTAHAATDGVVDLRPFIVETAEGGIRALGTRFAVRQWAGHTSVAVLESAVEITLVDASGQPQMLRAGERMWFTRSTFDVPVALDEQDSAWARGQIVADNVRLGDFMVELGRYRPGLVRCAPAVANLRFSVVFPLHNTDRILATLPSVLPVQVRFRTRYWVMVEATK
ncbi:FecR domain-containing protein [Candidatus Nitrotoga arctica]|nr:FecR domain-containing protein [Candidatus Nitrotoga arctica]